MKRIVITGGNGFLGWHTRVHLHAANANGAHKGELEVTLVSREAWNDTDHLDALVAGTDGVVHAAGINRATDHELEQGNAELAAKLVAALRRTDANPVVVYFNSTHAERETAYGLGKRRAAESLAAWAREGAGKFVDLVIPHVFGEHARANYNNVTATFCRNILDGVTPEINPNGEVELVHASEVAQCAVAALLGRQIEKPRLQGRRISVGELYDALMGIHHLRQAGIFPNLQDPFTLHLANTLLAFNLPVSAVNHPTVHSDPRGRLFEAAKGGGGGQSFVSWTAPGITRGGHYHLHKAERFVVLEGEATIRLRRLFDDSVHTLRVSGDHPTTVDIPTLHTHDITNTGTSPLITLFWAHEIFDPTNPDTYIEAVA